MMRGIWSVGWVVLVSIAASVGVAQEAQRFEGQAYDYSIEMPAGWEHVPEDVVRESFPAASDPDVPYEYDAVFAQKTDGPRFSSAYLVVQVTPYSALFRGRQPDLRERGIQQILADKSERATLDAAGGEMSVEQAVDRAAEAQDVAHYDPTDHTYAMAMDVPVRDVGNMRGQVYGWFGDDALVEVTMHVHAKLWPKYRGLYIDTVESFAFDEGADYQRGLFGELTPWIWRGGLALLLVGALLGALKLWRARGSG